MNLYYIIPAIILILIALGTIIFKIGKWTGSVDNNIKIFKDFIKEVRDDIKEILNRIPAKSVASGSPIQLTDLGKRISEKIDAKNLAGEFSQELFNEVKDKSPYEIQEFCINYVKSKKSIWTSNQLLEFGNCAYENGIPLDQVFDVIAVELRDNLLELLKNQAMPPSTPRP